MNQTQRMNKELSDRVNSGEHEFVTGESDNTAYICAECGVAAHEHRGVGWMAPEDRNSDFAPEQPPTGAEDALRDAVEVVTQRMRDAAESNRVGEEHGTAIALGMWADEVDAAIVVADALAGAPADASDAGLRAALQGMVSTFGSNHPLNPSIDYEDARRAHEDAAVSIAQKALAATPATTTEETSDAPEAAAKGVS